MARRRKPKQLSLFDVPKASNHPSLSGRRRAAVNVNSKLTSSKRTTSYSHLPKPPPLAARVKTKAKYGKTGRRIYPKTAKVIAMGAGSRKKIKGDLGAAKAAYQKPRRTYAARKLKVSNKAMGAAAGAGLAAYAVKRGAKKAQLGKKVANRHPTKLGAATVKGSVSRQVGKKYHVHADYVVTRDPSLVKLDKRGRNTLKGVTPEKGRGARGHHGRVQRRDSRGRFI